MLTPTPKPHVPWWEYLDNGCLYRSVDFPELEMVPDGKGWSYQVNGIPMACQADARAALLAGEVGR